MNTPYTRLLLRLLAICSVGAAGILILLLCTGAAAVRTGLKISQYPNNGFISSNALFITEKGDGSTNENISFGQLALRVTNSINASLSSFATTNYVNTATNALTNTIKQFASNLVVVLSGTNTLVSKTSTNGTNFYVVNADPFAITNGLATTNYANEVASNRVVVLSGTNTLVSMTSTNGTNFYAVNATASFSASSIGFETNQFTTNVAGTPVVGALWFNGTNGLPGTNEARTGIEYIPFWRSLRAGQVAAGADSLSIVGNGSNYWNNTNIGPLTIGFGSNAFVKGAFASVLGGAYNAINTNANWSSIAGGTDNYLDSNVHSSFIGSGNKNRIRNDGYTVAEVGNAAIVGGTNNTITGRGLGSFIGAGEHNDILGKYNVIGGGSNNNILGTNGSHNVIVGGSQNDVGIGASSSQIVAYNFIGGGLANDTTIGADYSVISGGRGNLIGDNSTNSVIAGGAFNTVASIGNRKFGSIIGGERNTVDANYGFIVGGASNSVTGGGLAEPCGVIGHRQTNGVANSLKLGMGLQSNFVHMTTAATTNQGLLRVGNGRASAYSSVGGIFTNVSTPVASAGASETNLITVTIPAHALTNNGDSFTFRTSGRFAATANAKDLKVVYGSETILDTSSQIVNSGAWTFEGEIIRTGNTSQSVNAEFHGAGVTLFTTAASLDLAQTNGINTVFKVTSTAAGDGDVTNRTMTVWLWPAP